MSIKSSAETFIKNMGLGIEHEYAKVVASFAAFAEGQQNAEAQAITLLQAAGYTVTAPVAAVAQVGAATAPTVEGPTSAGEVA